VEEEAAEADAGLPDFLGPNIPKREKIYQMTTNYTAINYTKWQ
jgi:hypothetical protein